MTAVLVEVVQFFKLIGMDNDVQTAHLSKTEFAVLHAREADLKRSSQSINATSSQSSDHSARKSIAKTNLFPRLRTVRLAGRVNRSLVLTETNQRHGQLSEVGDVVEEDLGRIKHAVVEATIANLKQKSMKRNR